MLFKYSGKYVNIYFNMKITFLSFTHQTERKCTTGKTYDSNGKQKLLLVT